MKSASTGVAAAQSKAVSWRRWTPASLPIMVRAATVRSAGSKDVDGHPLPPIPELSDMMSFIQCYQSCSSPVKGMGESIRRRVLRNFVTEMKTAVVRLRQRRLDLLWRFLWEKSPDGERELVVALALRRRKPPMPHRPAPDARRVWSI